MITRKVCADGNKLCPGKEWRLYGQLEFIELKLSKRKNFHLTHSLIHSLPTHTNQPTA